MSDVANGAGRTRTPTVVLAATLPAAIFLVLASAKAHDAVAKRLMTIASAVGVLPRSVGRDKWLIIAETGAAAAKLRQSLAAGLSAEASFLDQSDSRTVIVADGPDVREMLAKGIGMDLAPDSFPEGASAMTAFGHLTVQITRTAANRYDLIVTSSFADSLWESLREASLEFGCDAPEKLTDLG